MSSPPGSFLLGNSRLPGPPPGLAPTTGEPLLYNAQALLSVLVYGGILRGLRPLKRLQAQLGQLGRETEQNVAALSPVAEVRLQTRDLAASEREMARDWTPRALSAGVDLGYEGLDSLWVQGQAMLLREALGNLLDNALLYAGRSSVVTLRVSQLQQ